MEELIPAHINSHFDLIVPKIQWKTLFFFDVAQRSCRMCVFPRDGCHFSISEKNFGRLPTILHFLVDLCLFELNFVFVFEVPAPQIPPPPPSTPHLLQGRISTAASSAPFLRILFPTLRNPPLAARVRPTFLSFSPCQALCVDAGGSRRPATPRGGHATGGDAAGLRRTRVWRLL